VAYPIPFIKQFLTEPIGSSLVSYFLTKGMIAADFLGDPTGTGLMPFALPQLSQVISNYSLFASDWQNKPIHTAVYAADGNGAVHGFASR